MKRLQHKAARMILNNFDYINVRGHDLVNQLRWQTIEQRIDYKQQNLCTNVFTTLHQ